METNRGKCVCALRAIARERARRVRALGVDGERRFYLSRRRVARIGLHKRRGLRRATRVRTGSPPLSGRNKLISNMSRGTGAGEVRARRRVRRKMMMANLRDRCPRPKPLVYV